MQRESHPNPESFQHFQLHNFDQISKFYVYSRIEL